MDRRIPRPAPARGRYHHGELRRALLVAAEEELAENGVEGFTLRGCARRAGVSHAAPAHHFRDADALLTELAAIGFSRFTATVRERQAGTDGAARARLTAAGLGYVEFAMANPALFNLMFSSSRTDFDAVSLSAAAAEAFDTLVRSVRAVRGPDADEAALMRDVAAAWAAAHGLAGLLMGGHLKQVAGLPGAKREAALAEILARSVPEPPQRDR